MDRQAQGMAPLGAEVSMLAPEIVRQIKDLAGLQWGAKRIAAETGVARGTVRRYLRGGAGAQVQQRPAARRLDEGGQALAMELLDGPAQGNAVVVRRLMAERTVRSQVDFRACSLGPLAHIAPGEADEQAQLTR